MLQNTESLDLIARYLNNPADQFLQSEISKFCAESAENEAYFLEIEEIWNQSAAASILETIDEKSAVKQFKKTLKAQTPINQTLGSWFKAIAASVLLFIAGYLLYSQNAAPNYIIKATAKNQIDSVKLADGSVIILSENTELKYPDEFNSDTREIFLSKGQAFFKIARDVNHPFKVLMNKSDVEVLGTSFNIKLANNKIELGVKTGKVLFSPYKGGATSILTAGQALSYDIEKNELITKTAQNDDSWLTKELVFVDTPLDEVCKQLTEYYGVVIKLQDHKHTIKKLNAKFQNQSLSDVLIVLNETYNINIKKERNQINLITP